MDRSIKTGLIAFAAVAAVVLVAVPADDSDAAEWYWSGYDGGIFWEYDTSVVQIHPQDNPQEGYERGQMREGWEERWNDFTGYPPDAVRIHEGVSNICSDLFSGYGGIPLYPELGIKEAFLPKSLEVIGARAIRGCELANLTIPENVTYIGDEAFQWNNLTKVTVRPIVPPSMGAGVFSKQYGQSQLQIAVPAESFEAYKTAPGWSEYANIMVPEYMTYSGTDGNIDWSICKDTLTLSKNPQATDGTMKNYAHRDYRPLWEYHPFFKNVTSVVVKDSVENIGTYAFYNNSDLTSVTLSEGLKSLEQHAFSYCTGITSVTIPDSLTYLGQQSFQDCRGLMDITLGSGVMEIADRAFLDTDPVSIVIPDSVTKIGPHAFSRCLHLTTVDFGTGLEYLDPQAFVSHTFYGQDGTKVTEAKDLRNHIFAGTDIAEMHITSEVTVVANTDSWGSVDQSVLYPVPYGSAISAEGSKLTVNGVVVNATESEDTDDFDYGFVSWEGIPSDGIVREKVKITAVFSQAVKKIGFAVKDLEYGSVTPAVLENVPYGTQIYIDGDTLTIDGRKVTAAAAEPTAQYTYAFDSWSGIPADHIVTGPLTITPNFTRTVNLYTVEFVSDNPDWGSVGRSVIENVPYGSEVGCYGNAIVICRTEVFANPGERTAQYTYAFREWETPKQITGDTRIIAHFDRTVNRYTVTFDSSGGSEVPSQIVDYGSAVQKPQDPTRPGYQFAGWFYDNRIFDFGTPVTKDMLIVGMWQTYVKEYAVTFDNQGHGTKPDTQMVKEGQKATDPGVLTDEGYVFGGWFTKSSCDSGTEWDFGTAVTSSVVLYAKWTQAECGISSDGRDWEPYLTLDEGLQKCSDGWQVKVYCSKTHSSVLIDKDVTVYFDGSTFLSPQTGLRIAQDVRFVGMVQMPLTVTFAAGASLDTDTQFELTAKFDDPASGKEKVFVRGPHASDVAVAHAGYAAVGVANGIKLVDPVEYPYAVFAGGEFLFYGSVKDLLDDNPEASEIFVLNYVPLYEGGTPVSSYEAEAEFDRDLYVSTVTRVTDGTHSSFYIGTEEMYNNGASVPLPGGRYDPASLAGCIRVSAGHVLSVKDANIRQDVVLGGGKDANSADLATVRLTEKAPATKIIVGFDNLGKWIEKKQTSDGWVYELKEGCDYTFITSDVRPLNYLVGVNASGFRANISPNGLAGSLAASSSMVAYVKTAEGYTGYSSITDAVAQLKEPGSDGTLYILYRTTEKEGDQDTTYHELDLDLACDGSFGFAVLHQHVDRYGRASEYTLNDAVPSLIFAEGRTLTVTGDTDISRIYVDGTVVLEGGQTVDLGGLWGSDRTIVLDLSGHDAGTVVKNIGDAAWKVVSYPGDDCYAEVRGGSLVLHTPGSDEHTGIDRAVIVLAFVIALIAIVTFAAQRPVRF